MWYGYHLVITLPLGIDWKLYYIGNPFPVENCFIKKLYSPIIVSLSKEFFAEIKNEIA